jgi:hypothetical protein
MAWTRRHFDTFTDTGLTSLDAHTPDEGTGYTNPSGGGIRPTIDTAGTALRNGGGNGVYVTTTIGAKQRIAIILKDIASQSDARYWLRYAVNGGATIDQAANGYAFRLNSDGVNRLMLDRWDNGVRTNLIAAFGQTWANDDALIFEADGSNLRVLRNGTEIAASVASDATYTSGTIAFSHDVGADPCGDTLEVFDDTGSAASATDGLLVIRQS